MKFKVSELKKSLSECHISGKDPRLKLFDDITEPQYFLNRVMECIHNLKNEIDPLGESQLAIQLLNMYRVFYKLDSMDKDNLEEVF